MYGEKVMENVLFYLAHWIYRKFFNNYVLLHEKKWTLIECFLLYRKVLALGLLDMKRARKLAGTTSKR